MLIRSKGVIPDSPPPYLKYIMYITGGVMWATPKTPKMDYNSTIPTIPNFGIIHNRSKIPTIPIGGSGIVRKSNNTRYIGNSGIVGTPTGVIQLYQRGIVETGLILDA